MGWLVPWVGMRAPRQGVTREGRGLNRESILATRRQSSKRMQGLLARNRRQTIKVDLHVQVSARLWRVHKDEDK